MLRSRADCHPDILRPVDFAVNEGAFQSAMAAIGNMVFGGATVELEKA